MVLGKRNSMAAQDDISSVEDVLKTIHYIYATKGEITGMIAPAMVIVSIQVSTVFAPEDCDNLVWRASHYFKNMSWSVSRLKDLVSQAIRFLHPIICLRILAN